MKKAILTIDSDPVIEEACKKIREIGVHHNERAAFLKKQIDDAFKDSEKKMQEHWNVVHKRLEELGKKQPGKDMSLMFNIKENILCEELSDDSNGKMPKDIKDLLSMLLKD